MPIFSFRELRPASVASCCCSAFVFSSAISVSYRAALPLRRGAAQGPRRLLAPLVARATQARRPLAGLGVLRDLTSAELGLDAGEVRAVGADLLDRVLVAERELEAEP